MKKLITTLSVAAWIFFVCAPVWAEDIVVEITAPTQSQQCTAIPLVSPVAGFRLWQMVANVQDPTQVEIVLPNVKPGDYTFFATAIDETGAESRMSNYVTKTSTSFTVTNIVVKTVAKTPGRFLLLGVGTVPLGTPCDPDQEVNGHYAVPLEDVVWSDPARNAGTAPLPLLAVAQCG